MSKSRRRKKLSKAEAGRIGGHHQARHGIEHYRQAGKKGFMVTVARHWAGDKWSYIRYLHECGWLTEVLRLFEARPRAGRIKSIQIPLLPGNWRKRRRKTPSLRRSWRRSAPHPSPQTEGSEMPRTRLSPEEPTERRREAARSARDRRVRAEVAKCRARYGEKISWEETRLIALGICDALQAVHDNRFIHRDVKPANIFL